MLKNNAQHKQYQLALSAQRKLTQAINEDKPVTLSAAEAGALRETTDKAMNIAEKAADQSDRLAKQHRIVLFFSDRQPSLDLSDSTDPRRKAMDN